MTREDSGRQRRMRKTRKARNADAVAERKESGGGAWRDEDMQASLKSMNVQAMMKVMNVIGSRGILLKVLETENKAEVRGQTNRASAEVKQSTKAASARKRIPNQSRDQIQGAPSAGGSCGEWSCVLVLPSALRMPAAGRAAGASPVRATGGHPGAGVTRLLHPTFPGAGVTRLLHATFPVTAVTCYVSCRCAWAGGEGPWQLDPVLMMLS
eukprot:gene4411-biopygen4481